MLNQDEVKALPAAPPTRHRLGLRDRALLTLLYNTGARATEIVQLNIDGLRLETPAQVRILGKGRKERVCPLWQETADALRAYLHQRADETYVELASAILLTTRLTDTTTRRGTSRLHIIPGST